MEERWVDDTHPGKRRGFCRSIKGGYVVREKQNSLRRKIIGK